MMLSERLYMMNLLKVNTVETIEFSKLVKKSMIKKLIKIEKKVPNHDKYITINDLNFFLVKYLMED